MAKNTVGGLYVSLGLDISELDAGFALADKTVSQAISRFNSEAKQIRLQADIDTANAESGLEKLKVRYEALGKEIDIARQKEILLKREMEAAAKNFGADNAVTTRATTALLQQQKQTALLASRQRELKSALDASSSSIFSFADAARAAQGGVGGLANYVAMLAPEVAAVAAVLGAGMGLASLTKEAADTAAAIGDLGDKFGMAKEEAAQLMGTTKAAGVDTEGFVSWLTRLDRTITSAGAAGNETTRTLARFGVSLADGTGKLLSYNEQLRQVAEGYQNAKSVGQTEEFLSGLGRGAAQFADLFNKIDEYARRGGTMYGAAILGAVEPAQELTDRLAELDEQLNDLKLAFGAAFVPVAAEMIPPIVDGLRQIKGWLDDNKDGLFAFARAVRAAVGVWGGDLATAPFGLASDAMEAWRRLTYSQDEMAAWRDRKHGGKFEPDAATIKAERAAAQAEREAKAAAEAERKANEENAAAIEDIWRKATASKLENDLAAIEARQKKEMEAANLTEEGKARIMARYAAEREATLYKANQEMERMNRDLSDSIAKQTQGELENALRDIDRQAEATRGKYKNLFGEVSAETEALIQQNAELQRQNAVQSRADKALTSEKKYWDIFQKAMNGQTMGFGGGFKMFDLSGDMDARLKAAEEAIRAEMLRSRGIRDANVKTSDLQAFDALMKRVQGGGLANVIDDAGIMGEKVATAVSTSLSGVTEQMAAGMNAGLAPALDRLTAQDGQYQTAALGQYEAIRQSVDALAARMGEREAVAPVITVQIESAVTEDSASMTRLADTVADRINEVLVRYIGDSSSGRNTY